MRIRVYVSALAIGLNTILLLSCEPRTAPTKQEHITVTPSRDLDSVLHRFIEADTLVQHPKFYAAFIKQDSISGNLSVYVFDEDNSNGIKVLPLTTWTVDKKVFFVFTGLEAIATGGDTIHHHLIRETERANRGKIWSPPFRGWRIVVQDQKVTRVDKQVIFLPFDPPPPPNKY
ncbi:hypothetical protein KBK19_12440 [Microvirga sp. STR05]|uniref:Uncharacterized protein n=1 Tax=Hymenobacter duratus TaxID=2771356 RepID=A0ABR8JG55_9BACT|nr:hypothetical protein [Hymenobacter duratus]MBD2715845.1 hypothetical protein [Hymenobacter duratus]MBR7950756.1 hypothetical protein [Microvirga sp. STR05]